MVDRYTKTVLTVIAGCLLWLCVMTTGRPAHAQQLTQVGSLPAGVQPVVVVGWGSMDLKGQVALQLVNEGGARRTDPTMSIRAEHAVPVRLPYTLQDPLPARVTTLPADPLAVSISAVSKGDGPWDPIRTQVEPAAARDRPGGGK